MRQRQFITLFWQATLLWPLGAWAQQPDKIPRVGVIVQGDAHLVGLSGLRKGLRELGTEEGRHLSLTVRDTQGNLKAAERAAAELERDGVAVIVSSGCRPPSRSSGPQPLWRWCMWAEPIRWPVGSRTASRNPAGGSRASTISRPN